MSTNRAETGSEIYGAAARRLHWWTVALLAVQIPIGILMVNRGKERGIWDGLTNGLYSSHKLLGMVILLLVVVRLAYRVLRGAPSPEPSLATWQHEVSSLTHSWLYALLIVTPMLGWLGVSLYPALDIFGLFSLPALVPADQKASDYVFLFHVGAATLLVALIALHVGAALYHRVVRRDGVLKRMLPSAGP